MTQKSEDVELDLEGFFADEAARDVQPSAVLMAVILGDAQEMQPHLAGFAKPATRPWSFKLDIWDALGGWGTASALSACLLVGVTLGYTPPTSLDGIANTFLENAGFSVTEDDFFMLDDILAEG
ncbi:MAG: hypothetical protein ACI9ZD_002387 [Paracoccaceae bacterium]|jgi:hypothetical protein